MGSNLHWILSRDQQSSNLGELFKIAVLNFFKSIYKFLKGWMLEKIAFLLWTTLILLLFLGLTQLIKSINQHIKF